MTTKSQRQHRIAALLEEEVVSSQDRLVELLANAGISATQATVSRDLEDLGAVKVRVGGGSSVYAIPDHPHEQVVPTDHLRRVFGEWVLSADWSANLVVLRTPPGSAHAVASAIDRAGLDGILGSVAGDDTIMVITSRGVDAAELCGTFKEIASIESDS